MRNLLTLIICCLLTVSCAKTRETAKAVINADVNATAITKLATSKDVADSFANLSDDDRKRIIDVLTRIIKLSQTINYSLKPAIVELSKGESMPPSYTVDEAIEQTDTVVAKAMMQAGKAEIEVQQNESNRKMLQGLIEVGSSFLSNSTTLSALLTGGGGLGLIALGLLKRLNTYRKSLDDQVDYAKEMKQIPPDLSEEELIKIQSRHAAKQDANGTRGIIKAALQRKKS